MAVITPTPSSPLSQALARRRGSPLPAIMLALGLIVAIGCAVLGYLESQRTEQVVVLIRDVPFGQQISPEDLGVLELPLHRPAQMAGIAATQAVTGKYAARDLGANDLVQPAMLLDAPPDQPVYPNGQQLSPDMVPVPFSTATIGPISFRDTVNIGFNDQSGDVTLCDRARSAAAGAAPTMLLRSAGPTEPRPYACRLLGGVRVLYVDEAEGIAFLELTPYQSHTVWALQAAGLQLWGERYGVTSQPLDALTRLDVGQVNLAQLTEPVAEASAPPTADPAIPGAGGTLPGATRP